MGWDVEVLERRMMEARKEDLLPLHCFSTVLASKLDGGIPEDKVTETPGRVNIPLKGSHRL